MLIPQAMAYAVLAGMPPIYGLYGALLPLAIYAFLGSSRHLSVGPVAITSLLVLAGISTIAAPGSPEYISLVIGCGLLSGVFQLLIGVVRLGFLANFLSYPVITGFTAAAAVIIALSQLKDFLGLPIPADYSLWEGLAYSLQHLEAIHWPTVVMGLGGIFLMLLLKRYWPRMPAALLAVVFGTLLCYGLHLPERGMAIIGTIPQGLPPLAWPNLTLAQIPKLLPTALTLTIIGLVECISIGKRVAQQGGGYDINPNQEMIAIGLAKIGGAFFSALPSSGSFSRSAVNVQAGARTQVSTLIAMCVVLLTLLFLMPLFYYLPKAILAAIILLSVYKLLAYQEAKNLWLTDRSDFWMLTSTFVATLVLGIEGGVLTGVLLSLCMVLFRISKPHITVLGRVPGKNFYRSLDRFEEAIAQDDHLIIRFDQQLYFGNADYFKNTIRVLICQHQQPLRSVFLDAKGVSAIDSSGLNSLLEVQRELSEKGARLVICNPIGPVRDRIERHNRHSPEEQLSLSLFLHDAVELGT